MELVNQRRHITNKDTPCAVALGFFDGVHLGHREVLGTMLAFARKNGLRPAVFTFTQNENSGQKGQTILLPPQKHRLLAEMGIETCYEPPFKSFADLSPESFFNDVLIGEFNTAAIFCGEDFGFGAKRAGNAALLKQLCAENGIHFSAAKTALYKGDAVSSTRIKAALACGDIESANAMLGRPYEIELPVTHGRRLGSSLGFPTANQIFPPALAQPSFGVYATRAVINGEEFAAATGFGTRPTVDGGSPSCETFIINFAGTLYDENLTIRFYKRLADAQKFSGLAELAAAIKGWARQAEEYFDGGCGK